jgi:hypothetical protein
MTETKDIQYLIQRIHEETTPEGKRLLDELIEVLIVELNEIKASLIILDEK